MGYGGIIQFEGSILLFEVFECSFRNGGDISDFQTGNICPLASSLADMINYEGTEAQFILVVVVEGFVMFVMAPELSADLCM